MLYAEEVIAYPFLKLWCKKFTLIIESKKLNSYLTVEYKQTL